MVVCHFFLRGNCKFGDRCRNEHPRGGIGGGYPSYGGGGYQSFGGRGNFAYSSRGDGSYGSYGQQQSNHNNPYVYRKDTSGGRNYDGRSDGSNYDGYGGGGTYGRSGGSQNRFGVLSNLGDHMQNGDTKEHEILDIIKQDAKEWEASQMWPLSCYKPNKARSYVPGFEDISPDEVRYLAYTAEKENKFDQHKATFAAVLNIYKSQRDVMQNPSRDLKTRLINAFRGAPTSSSVFGNTDSPVELMYGNSTVSGGSGQAFGGSGFGSASTGFGSMPASSDTSGFGGSTMGKTFTGNFGIQPSQGQAGGSASTGLFGKQVATGSTGTRLFGKPAPTGSQTGLFGNQASSGTTGAGLFGKPATIGVNDTGGSGGIVGAGGSSSQVGLFGKPPASGTSGNSQPSSFGMTQVDFRSPQGSSWGTGAPTSPQTSTYTPLNELTAEEKEQFKAQSFMLGKVPTRPPPIELCR
ncbi:nucleoporin-like protein 2 [Acanthaster planci]|uniref:Nucleoporin NUP42 n=1 Tax=Acanthaster planci TaxID=133434 RepID=A0A8B7XRI1_ACAPL|nr:nucleoporin-like protein 2 [Acanthaster planci]